MGRIRLLTTAASLLALLAATGAYAQAAAGVSAGSAAPSANATEVETIIVTAQKRSENIQEVPLSIRAVSGDALVNAGVRNPIDLQRLVPSLQVTPTLFGAGIAIRIRGFGSAGNSATDSDVASYMDGAYIPRPGATLASFLDVQNVEVLSGPQGTLFGRNAALGAISVNSNPPSFSGPSLELKAEAGSYGTYGVTGVANLPLTDTFAIRGAITSSHTDGIYHNNLDGRTYGESDILVGRFSTRWEITPKLNWIVRVDGSRTDGDGEYPATVDVGTASAASLTALANFNTRFGGSPQVYSADPSFTINQFVNHPFVEDRQYGVVSDLSYSATPDLTVRLIDTYRDWSNKQLAGDTISTSLNLLSVLSTFSSKAQSHELQLISSKGAFLGGHLGFTAGLYYFQEEYRLGTIFPLGPQYCPVIFTTVGLPFLIPGCKAGPQANPGGFYFNQNTNSYAGYAQANFQILPKLELDAGVRETHDTKSANLLAISPNALALGAILKPEGPEALTFSDTKPSFRASLSYHATDRVLLFGTFDTGYKSGGFNSGGSNPALTVAQRTFASETVEDYEVGVKSIFWDGRVLINTTLFDTELHNFQDKSFSGTSFFVRNSGDVRSRGVDFDGQLNLGRGLRLTSGITYLDSAYTTNLKAPGLQGCTGATGSCPTTQNLSGRELQFAPRYHGNVSAQYTTQEFMNGYTATGSVTYNYTSSFLTDNNDNPQSRLPGFGTGDFRLSLNFPNNKVQVEVFGTNVFDKHYYVSTVAQVLGGPLGVNNAATGATLYRGFLGDPQRFGGRVSLKF